MIRAALKVLGWPLAIGTSRLPHGAHVTRYAMYEALKSSINDPGGGLGKRTLNISHSNRLIRVLGIERSEIVDAAYPEHSAADLSAFSNDCFNYVVSDQVLEHVEDSPQKVFDETLRVLKPGGIGVHTTCFINPIHGWPSDFWRFTPAGLEFLAKGFSEIIACDGFGNRFIWYIDILGLRMVPVPHSKWHPMHQIATRNMKNWPVSVWVVARK